MVQFLFANDVNGSLVDISKVTSDNREQYFCPSCGMEMSAVLGNKREHHYRHKGDSCSYESYLHKISKLLVKQRFDGKSSFEIAYFVTKECPKSDCPLRTAVCANRARVLHKVNLKERYNCCEIEGSHAGFRADVKLFNSDKPEIKPLFIEIAVSHECTPEKLSSGIPIIEIKVANEEDALRPLVEQDATSYNQADPYRHLLQPMSETVKFYNFERNISPDKTLSRFIIYKGRDGYLRGGVEKDYAPCTMVGNRNENALCEIQFVSSDIHRENRFPILYFGMFKLVDEGIEIKNCRICKHFSNCKVQLPTDTIDPRTNSRVYGLYQTVQLTEQHFVCLANKCPHFRYHFWFKAWTLKYYKNLKYHVCK